MQNEHQFEKTMNLKYLSSSGELKMNFESDDADFHSSLNELEIDPRIVNIGFLKINRDGTQIEFSSPILCKTDGEHFETQMMGVKFEGKKPDSLLKKMPNIQKKLFGGEWERAVEKQKERIENGRKL
ncbi:MAG: hypothetical protein U9R21_08735 [Candidatus Thermoplasmatota archaeon]|nr:hypothetical protein [Candidatus Thermoplasmatota archaeon]